MLEETLVLNTNYGAGQFGATKCHSKSIVTAFQVTVRG